MVYSRIFIFRFGPNTKHLVINDLGSELGLLSVYDMQAKLNLLHPGIFPLLPHQLVPVTMLDLLSF